MLDINYSDFLSIDNKKGLLFNKNDINILTSYGFDYRQYSTYNELIFDLNNYINSTYEDLGDLEEVLVRISEINYYHYINK